MRKLMVLLSVAQVFVGTTALAATDLRDVMALLDGATIGDCRFVETRHGTSPIEALYGRIEREGASDSESFLLQFTPQKRGGRSYRPEISETELADGLGRVIRARGYALRDDLSLFGSSWLEIQELTVQLDSKDRPIRFEYKTKLKKRFGRLFASTKPAEESILCADR